MKRVIFLAAFILTCASSAHAYTSPGKPQGFVNDYAEIIGPSAQSGLESALSAFAASTTIQIAVVTVPSLGDETIEMYAVKLFEEWGIGDEEKDNGALLLVAPNEREVRIEVGYGLEGVLTDAQSYGIIQKIILPEFRAGNYEQGIIAGTQAVMQVVQSEADYSAKPSSKIPSLLLSFLQQFGFVIFIVLASVLGRTKSWWLGGVVGALAGIIIGIMFGFFFTGVIATVLLTLFGLLLDFIVSKNHGTHGPGGGFWGGFGGGSHGSGGGSFGGFGGGMSGGGGSSGRW